MRDQRLLLPTCMLEAGRRNLRRGRVTVPPIHRGCPRPEGPEARLDSLRKLKALFDSGVLTYQQFTDEHDRLLGD